MGNLTGRYNNSRRAFGLAWTSWRLSMDQDQAKNTLKRIGCLYCLVFFLCIKFISLALLFALPTVMIGMGVFYMDDCPIAPFIPVFLIILGCFGVLETIIYILRSFVFCERCDIPLFIWEFSKILVFGFFTWGSVRIFELYTPSYDRSDSRRYCDKALYLFAFSIITILWIILVLFLLLCLLLLLVLSCAKDEVLNEEPPQEVDSVQRNVEGQRS